MEDCYDEILVLCNDKRDQQEKFNYILDRLNRFNYIRFIYPNYISSGARQMKILSICNDEKWYRGRRPTFYYGYGATYVDYMNAVRSTRLSTLDDIVMCMVDKD